MPERVRLSRAGATEGGHQFTTVVVCAWPRLGAGCCDVAPGCVGGRCRGGSPIRPPPPSLLLPSLLSSSPSSPFSLSLSFQSFMTWTCSWRATRSRPSRRQASAPSFLQTHLMIWFVAASRVGGERGDGGRKSVRRPTRPLWQWSFVGGRRVLGEDEGGVPWRGGGGGGGGGLCFGMPCVSSQPVPSRAGCLVCHCGGGRWRGGPHELCRAPARAPLTSLLGCLPCLACALVWVTCAVWCGGGAGGAYGRASSFCSRRATGAAFGRGGSSGDLAGGGGGFSCIPAASGRVLRACPLRPYREARTGQAEARRPRRGRAVFSFHCAARGWSALPTAAGASANVCTGCWWLAAAPVRRSPRRTRGPEQVTRRLP